jgi:hypothetical protein
MSARGLRRHNEARSGRTGCAGGVADVTDVAGVTGVTGVTGSCGAGVPQVRARRDARSAVRPPDVPD